MYLVFIGSFGFAIKCKDYTWVGWGAGIFTFLNVAFSCWVMNNHAGFLTLTGHEDYSETTDRTQSIAATTNFENFSQGTAMKRPVVGGGGSDYAPPSQQGNNPFGSAPDPYASPSVPQQPTNNGIFPEANNFDANPFA